MLSFWELDKNINIALRKSNSSFHFSLGKKINIGFLEMFNYLI